MSKAARRVETIELPYRPPYDWPAMLAFLKHRAITGIENVSGDTYTRTIDIGGLLYTSPSPRD